MTQVDGGYEGTTQGQDAFVYEPTPYALLDQIFARLRLSAEDVFVDIGCGKGRVVCYAAR